MKQFFVDTCKRIMTKVFGDAAPTDSGLFLARQLTSIKSKSYDQKYANLKAKDLFPVSHEHPAGTDTIAIPSYDGATVVKQINGYATDLPKTEIIGKETLIRVHWFGNAYEYNKREIRQAQIAGVPLQQRKANTAHRGHEENFNTLAFSGDGVSIYGLFTYPGIPRTSATGNWSGLTADQILADMNTGVSVVRSTTKMVEEPNTMLLPVAQYELIRTTYRATNSDRTILEAFKLSNPEIEVIPVNEMAGAGAGGVDVMVVYRRDPDIVTLEIPMEPMHNAPQEKGLGFEVPLESECGGLAVYYPLAFNIVEDI